MNNKGALGTLAVLAAIILVGAFGYHWYKGREDAAMAPEPVDTRPPPEPPQPPQYPVPQSPPQAPAESESKPAASPLPDLGTSDAPFRSSVEALTGSAPLEAFLVPDGVIRKLVVSIDNLSDSTLGMRFRAIKKIDGDFTVETRGDAIYLSSENYARYDRAVNTLEAVDTGSLVALYFRYYPLFQEAYKDLGYPSRYFNDRVIAIIDHLLATPDVSGSVELVRPKVLYQYKDPDLESLSVGQKTLIRMGPEHAASVKAKLREIRKAIIAGTRERGEAASSAG